jgi:hypothetical protein
MRYKLLVVLILSFFTSQSQVNNLFGAYTANWIGPSFRFLFLNCDSTYQFITDWDYQVNNEFNPPREIKKRRSVDLNMKITLEEPPFDFNSFVVQSDGTLLQPMDSKGFERTWSPIGKVNKDCEYDWIVEIDRTGFTIHKIKPKTQILVSESFVNNQLVERRTNHILTDSEYEELDKYYGDIGEKMKRMMLDKSDLLKQLQVTLDYLKMNSDVESVEKWDNGKVTITLYDKNGVMIKK